MFCDNHSHMPTIIKQQQQQNNQEDKAAIQVHIHKYVN